jgi:hypothetical protein
MLAGGGGVEILENRPYVDGPGGAGQYTKKAYHIAEKLPGWLRSIIPNKDSLVVYEEVPTQSARALYIGCLHMFAESSASLAQATRTLFGISMLFDWRFWNPWKRSN